MNENTEGAGKREACHASTLEGSGMPPANVKTPGEPRAGKPQTLREFERCLRGLGYSQREAKGIARQGFAFVGGADAGPDLSELAKSLAQQTSFFLKD